MKPPARFWRSAPASPIFIPATASPIISISAATPPSATFPADKLVKLPDHITYEQGAVLMLKGLTVWYLLHKTFKVEPDHRVLIHAAAGGIGLLACQWAKAMGAHVIGTVGTKAKADLALANGCDHVILYNEEDFVARVKQISRNELCDVVYDGVGKTTFPGSLSCLRPRGLFVSFGNASGPVPPFSIAELNNHGSLFATRPKLNDYVGTAQGTAGRRRHAVLGRHQRQAARADQPRLRAEGCGQGAYRAREQRDHGRVDLEAVDARRPSFRDGRVSTDPNPCLRGIARCFASLRNDARPLRHPPCRPIRVRIASRPSIISEISSRVTLSAGMKRRASGCGEFSSTPSASAWATIEAPIGMLEVERQQQPAAAHFAETVPRRQSAAIRFPETARHRRPISEIPACRPRPSTASPTAHISGLPLKVPPWSPCSKQDACFGRQQGRQRHAAADALAERHDVGLDAGVLVVEQLSGPAHAGLDLVDDQQQAVRLGQRAQLLQKFDRSPARRRLRPGSAPA